MDLPLYTVFQTAHDFATDTNILSMRAIVENEFLAKEHAIRLRSGAISEFSTASSTKRRTLAMLMAALDNWMHSGTSWAEHLFEW